MKITVCPVLKPYKDKYKNVYVHVEYDSEGRLSITGHWRCSFGQICDDIASSDCVLNKGWTRPKLNKLIKIWQEHHLNDLHPECEHQRELGWNEQARKKLFINGKIEHASFVYETEHEKGLLLKPCPVCGYKYGSKWNFVPVPPDVITWLSNLPASVKGDEDF